MNKKKFFAPFALLGAFLLAGCSSTTIVAKPDGWGDIKIIDKDVKDNNLLKVYTAIKELGDTNSNVLNSILYKISVIYYGTYEEIYKFGSTDSFNDVKSNEEFKKFVLNDENHYKNYVNITKKYDSVGDKEVDLNEEEKLEVAYNNIKNVYKQILEDSYKAIYTEITGGTYSTDNEFYEERYVVNNLFKNMYINKTTLSEATFYTKKELPIKGLDQTYEDYVRHYVHIFKDDDYTSKKNPTESTLFKAYFEDKLIPDVFRTLLIQNYVKTQRESTLGRTYARKIKMVSVPMGGTTIKGSILNLFKYFSKNYITGENITGKYDFSFIEKAMRGYGITNIDKDLGKVMVDCGFELICDSNNKPIKWNYMGDSGKQTYVFKGTKLGDLVEKYLKIYDVTVVDKKEESSGHEGNFNKVVKSSVEEASYNDLTGTNSYSIEHGLLLKEREINKTTYTKEGWYLKSGTISELGTDYKDRLFNISVSEIIDKKESKDYSSGDYARYYDYKDGDTTKKHAFLTYKSVQAEDPENLVIINDNSNFSIIEIEEAVSTSKLANNFLNKGSYLRLNGGGVAAINRFNTIQNDVTIESSKGDTYKKNANQFYLMITNVIVSDQSLYDYLKGQFPDLFNN